MAVSLTTGSKWRTVGEKRWHASAYFASAAAKLPLQNVILANSCSTTSDPAVSKALAIWKTLSRAEEPVTPGSCFEKVWDNIVTSEIVEELLSGCNKNIDKARIKTAGAAHAGDWLNATSIHSLGLRLSDGAKVSDCRMEPSE